MADLLVIGVCSVDFIGKCYGDFPDANTQSPLYSHIVTTGGNALNTAIDASKIGIDVSLVGCIGTDYHGDFLLSQTATHGIDTSGIQRCASHSTGSCTIIHNKKQERIFFPNKGANGELDLNSIPQSIIKNVKVVVLSGLFLLTSIEMQLSDFFKKLKRQKKIIIVDTSPNIINIDLNYIDKICYSIARFVDYFIPSETEAFTIGGTNDINNTFRELHSKGFNNVIIKRAEKGSCVSLNNGTQEYIVNAIEVLKIVDSTGAGDAYIAGFSYGLINHYTIRDSVLFGNILGAQCIQAIGATQGIDEHFLHLFLENSEKTYINSIN